MASGEEAEQSAMASTNPKKRSSPWLDLNSDVIDEADSRKKLRVIEPAKISLPWLDFSSNPKSTPKSDVPGLFRRWVSSSSCSSCSSPVLVRSDAARASSGDCNARKFCVSGASSSSPPGTAGGVGQDRSKREEIFSLPGSSAEVERSSPGLSSVEEAQSGKWVESLKVMNYGRSSSMAMASRLRERRHLQKTMLLPPSRGLNSVEESEMAAEMWIRRWMKAESPEREREKEEEEHGFPSLAAMALMGKAIRNFRPCNFQRKGSALVWNMDEV